MSEWNLYGTSRKEVLVDSLTPERLNLALRRYQSELDEEFSIKDLIDIKKIEAMALIAEAINDAPEFLSDQIGKMRNGRDTATITDRLDAVSYAISDLAEAVREHV
jgi:hypothetical protein